MTTYQVGDVAETNDGRLAFVSYDDDEDGVVPLKVAYERAGGYSWLSRNGVFGGDRPDHPDSLRRLVWRNPERAKREAQAKREQAAKLLAEAEQLEQSANQ